MDLDSLIGLILFVTPGFVAAEVANFFTPRRSPRHTERERVLGMLVLGCFVFGLFAALTGRSFGEAWSTLQTPERVAGAQLVLLLPAAICCGLAWASLKGAAIPWAHEQYIQWLLSRRKPAYRGDRPVWNLLSEQLVPNTYAIVSTDDGRIYYGHVCIRPTLEGDRDIVLDDVSAGNRKETGELDLTPLESTDRIFISGATIRSIIVRPGLTPDDEGETPAVTCLTTSTPTEASPTPEASSPQQAQDSERPSSPAA